MYGSWGRSLEVDLGKRSSRILDTSADIHRKFLGGPGLAARFLWPEPVVAPLAPEAPMVFAPGLLTGSKVPTASKYSICARSPLTGIWNESSVGGFWGPELKSCGYDALIVRGASETPVCLYIHDGEVEFRPARDLWGQDTYVTEQMLRAETDPKARVACIGPAGENGVLLAGIIAEGRHARAGARGGMGAVAGSKRLKAIAVRGSQGVPLFAEERLRAAVREWLPKIRTATQKLSSYGTAGDVEAADAAGDLPVQNWRGSSWQEGASRICGQELARRFPVKNYACSACPIGCGKDIDLESPRFGRIEGRGIEYETAASLGSLVLNDDLELLLAANELCNRYGMDTMSVGSAIAFAIEAAEKGILPRTGHGLPLSWGDSDTILGLIHQIARGEGLGRLLGAGVRRAADSLGGMALEIAVHVKGLEMAMHDPRAYTTLGLNYATGNRGACHLETLSHVVERGTTMAGIDVAAPLADEDIEQRVRLVTATQNLMQVYNALGLCRFLRTKEIGPAVFAEWVNLVTGWDMDQHELMRAGERNFTLKRCYNVRLGITRKDDTLPPRILTWARQEGKAKGRLPRLGEMLGKYYEGRGYDEFGVPSPATLTGLGLDFITLDNQPAPV